MECNPIFWLSSKYGHVDNPINIVTEYTDPVFNIAPTYEKILSATSGVGIALKSLKHSREYCGSYGKNFPVWDFYEFVKL